MTKPPAITGRQCIAALSKDGWTIRSHRGSHVKMVKAGIGHPVIVPVHGGETIPKGTLHSIIKDAGLTVEEFLNLL